MHRVQCQNYQGRAVQDAQSVWHKELITIFLESINVAAVNVVAVNVVPAAVHLAPVAVNVAAATCC